MNVSIQNISFVSYTSIFVKVVTDINTSILFVQHYANLDFHLNFVLQQIIRSRNLLILIIVFIKINSFRYFVHIWCLRIAGFVGREFKLDAETADAQQNYWKLRKIYKKYTSQFCGIFLNSRRSGCSQPKTCTKSWFNNINKFIKCFHK